ncbi:MAG: glycoside hydrolase family 2 TIM barrel-domain containing protein [Clostridia bacterium]
MRTKLLLNEGWKFHLGDIPHKKVTGKYPTYMHSKAKNGLGAAMASFYDGDFEDVRIPHDYVVSGEFDPLFNDTQGALERKTAWYRRHFNLPCQIDGKRFILVFDGAGKNSTVWCNGSLAGQNQSLYNAFYMDITPYLLDNTTNTISVKIENDDIEGWWYEGAGIYRDVWLIITDEISVDMWGTYVKPTLVEDENWKVDVETTVWNNSMQNIDAQVVQSIIDSENNIITSVKTEISARYSENLINQQLEIKSPKLWDLETPNLYNLKTEIYTNGKKIDDYDTSFGFRTLKYDNEKGFFLNGRSVKQRGLCYHQDHSNLGIALSVTNHKHRIKMMKEMGVNAYRSAHNPTAPGFLDLCDQNGIMVMEENRWFNWSEKTKKELITTLKCARNHPSVVIWSMGNEEPLQNTETGKRLAEELTKLINLYDDTRPSTLALNAGYFTDYAPAVTQVLGANYNAPLYKEMHEKHPSKPIIASETSLAAGNRGIYFESENHDIMNRGGYVDDYDLKRGLVVGSSCKETIKCMEENDFVGGTYMWTGEEYRGEAQWPKLFASSGATDSCGFMKDKAYLIKSLWTTQPMVHVFPHWSLQGKQGDTIQVVAYNNACQVELFVNGESAGRKQNERFNPPQWFVEYQPGCIEAVAYDETGKIIATDKSVTAGEAKTLVIENELEGVTNTGEDFAFFTLYLLEADCKMKLQH